MITALLLPVLLSVVLGYAAPWLGRRAAPGTAARLLPVAALVLAASSVLSLAAVGVLVLARWDAVARVARLSAHALPWACHHLPAAVGLGPAAAAALLGGALVRAALTTTRDLAAARTWSRSLPAGPGGSRVSPDQRPQAVSVAGLTPRRPGTVVVSTGLLALLGPGELRAVLAHERSHLLRRHHASLVAVRLAVAADPLLRAVLSVVREAVEREADEDAAGVAGRRTVATALARTALAGSDTRALRARAGQLPTGGVAGAVGLGGGDTPRRVEALLRPPVRVGGLAAVPLVAVIVAAAVLFVVNGLAADHGIDAARAAWAAASLRSSG